MEPVRTNKVTAIVLAGGRSARMKGRYKSMLPVRGVPMIQHIVRQLEPYFLEIIIGTNDSGKYRFLGHRIIPDIEEGIGPLMGIYSCLTASGCDLNFVTACDIPDISIRFIRSMLDVSGDADIVMPVSGVNNFEPLYAIYRKSVIPLAAGLISEKRFRVADLFEKVKTKFIPFEGHKWYRNINYMEDYCNYEESQL